VGELKGSLWFIAPQSEIVFRAIIKLKTVDLILKYKQKLFIFKKTIAVMKRIAVFYSLI
jgi:hypothetical protein